MSKSKYDNDFKSLVIEKGYYKDFLSKRKELYHDSKYLVLNDELGTLETHHDCEKWFSYFNDNINDPYFDCSLRLLESRSRKFGRCNKKIAYIIDNYKDACFITLTFSDDVLASTSIETRRRYVARFLKENCDIYVANIDFSPKKKREHYHAVIGSRINLKGWKYGFSFSEKVRFINSSAQLSHYINKLSSHAFKVVNTTRLIYSRNWFNIILVIPEYLGKTYS